MKPKPYNPCADGFPAKLWESLRRNKCFIEECRSFRTIKSRSELESRFALIKRTLAFDPAIHIIAGILLRPGLSGLQLLLSGKVVSENANSLGKKRMRNLTKAWPHLDKDIRDTFIGILSREQIKTPLVSSSEIASEISQNKFIPSKGKQSYLLKEISDCSNSHRLLLLPVFVWDSAHKKEIIKDVAAFLKKPRFEKKLLKPNGRYLGTEKEWEVFLDFEAWRRLGLDEKRATNLAAYLESAGVSNESPRREILSLDSDIERLKAAETFCRRYKQHPHFIRAKTRIGRIESGIDSVYPKFSLFRDMELLKSSSHPPESDSWEDNLFRPEDD